MRLHPQFCAIYQKRKGKSPKKKGPFVLIALQLLKIGGTGLITSGTPAGTPPTANIFAAKRNVTVYDFVADGGKFAEKVLSRNLKKACTKNTTVPLRFHLFSLAKSITKINLSVIIAAKGTGPRCSLASATAANPTKVKTKASKPPSTAMFFQFSSVCSVT